MTLIFPDSNIYSVQSASRIGAALTEIGIDITMKTLIYPQILDRIFYKPVYSKDGSGGVDYVHGGFDVYFGSWKGGIIPDEFQYYSSKAFVPQGNNYQFLNDSYIDQIMNTEKTSANETLSLQAYELEQQYVYANVTISIISQPQTIYALYAGVQGFNPFLGSSSLLNNISLNKLYPDTSHPYQSNVKTYSAFTYTSTKTVMNGSTNWFSSPEVIGLIVSSLGIILLSGVYIFLKIDFKKSDKFPNKILSKVHKQKGVNNRQEKNNISSETLDLLQNIIDENK